MEISGVLLSGIMVLGMIALMIASLVFWIRMIIDCANREFKSPNDKIVWILVLVFLQVLGAVIYWAVVKKPAVSKP